MSAYEKVQAQLRAAPKTSLITGVAGFIGSNLLEALLQLDQRAVGLDNFATGKLRNLDQVQALVTPAQWARFRFVEGDVGDPMACRAACEGADFVVHKATLGSVPRSMAGPLATPEANVTGFVNMLVAARRSRLTFDNKQCPARASAR